MKKKLLVLLLIVLLLCSCNKKENEDESKTPDNHEPTIQVATSNHEMKVGEMFAINVYTLNVSNLDTANINYEMDNPIGTLNNNIFIATKEGETTITISNGTDEAKVKIKVTK